MLRLMTKNTLKHFKTSTRASLCLMTITLVGCTSLKKAALIGGGSLGAAAIASIVTSGTAPALLAGAVGASVTSVAVDVMTPSKKGGAMATASSCAPDNFWTALGDLISVSGYGIILVILIPMVFSWLLPGPVKFKGRDK
jgi:hypothetical protein